jgi:uncharacterized protein (DUF58 family)
MTNFGLGFILMTLLVAIAAANTSNNGLYTVLAGLLAAMVVSGVVSRRNIRAVECRVEAAGEIFAGQPAALSVTLRNRSARTTAQGIWFLHEALPGPLYVAPLSPGEERQVLVEAVYARRGAYLSADSGIMSRFPIGLFRKYREARFPREIVVYPRPVRTRLPPREERTGRGSRDRSTRRGFGSETRMLREFASGDDLRDLHWKQSARQGKWIVREREDERSRKRIVSVENAVSDPLSPPEIARVEEAITAVAGEALAFLATGGQVGLVARGCRVAPAGGAPQRQKILDALARLPIYSIDQAPPLPAAAAFPEFEAAG